MLERKLDFFNGKLAPKSTAPLNKLKAINGTDAVCKRKMNDPAAGLNLDHVTWKLNENQWSSSLPVSPVNCYDPVGIDKQNWLNFSSGCLGQNKSVPESLLPTNNFVLGHALMAYMVLHACTVSCFPPVMVSWFYFCFTHPMAVVNLFQLGAGRIWIWIGEQPIEMMILCWDNWPK